MNLTTKTIYYYKKVNKIITFKCYAIIKIIIH